MKASERRLLGLWLDRVYADLRSAYDETRQLFPEPEPHRYRQWNNSIIALGNLGRLPTDDDPDETWHWEEITQEPAELVTLDGALRRFSEEIVLLIGDQTTPPERER